MGRGDTECAPVNLLAPLQLGVAAPEPSRPQRGACIDSVLSPAALALEAKKRRGPLGVKEGLQLVLLAGGDQLLQARVSSNKDRGSGVLVDPTDLRQTWKVHGSVCYASVW